MKNLTRNSLIMLAFIVFLLQLYSYYNTTIFPSVIYDLQRYARYVIWSLAVSYALLLTQWSWEKTAIYGIAYSHVAIVFYFFFIYALLLPGPIAILLVLLFAILLRWIKRNAWWRTIVIVPTSICLSVAILLLALPKYNTVPKMEDFYDYHGIKLHIIIKDIPMTLRDVSSEVLVRSSANPNQERKFQIKESSPVNNIYHIMKPTRIEFSSSKPLYNTFAFIQFYDGEVFPIPSQSIVSIDYTQTWYQTTRTWIQVQENLEDAQSFIEYETNLLDQLYQQNYNDFFIEAIWWPWLQNPYIDAIIGYSLQILNRYLPRYYGDNYKNYKDSKSIIQIDSSWTWENEDRLTTPEQSISIWDIVGPGLQQTRLFKRFMQ